MLHIKDYIRVKPSKLASTIQAGEVSHRIGKALNPWGGTPSHFALDVECSARVSK